MQKTENITPEIILQKYSRRLRKKKEELEYLVCMNRQFEKWLQYELVLTMSKMALPVVYGSDYSEIRYQYEDGTWEQICDISTEYPMQDLPHTLRPDICIAEKPFVSKYIDKKTWMIRDDEAYRKCEYEYGQARYHYIELKQLKWVGIDDPDIVSTVMTGDLKKYSDQDWRTLKSSYNPSSFISFCFVPFWNPAKPHRRCSILDMRKAIKKIRTKATAEGDQYFGMRGTFTSKCVMRELCLLMLSYKL
jgi:hypothetical protein